MRLALAHRRCSGLDGTVDFDELSQQGIFLDSVIICRPLVLEIPVDVLASTLRTETDAVSVFQSAGDLVVATRSPALANHHHHFSLQ